MLHAHAPGGPAEPAGHGTRVHMPLKFRLEEFQTMATVGVYPVKHTQFGEPDACIGHGAGVQKPVHAWLANARLPR